MDKRLKHLNALYSFESAARHQSYSKAAEELFVSQAAISQQMRLLEDNLSIKLFVRNGRNMQLTPQGQKLYVACQKGFNSIIQGINSVQCEGIDGELTITSTQAFCSLWLMPRLYKFSQLHPNINVKILGSNQVEDLQKKHIDLAIRFSTESNPSYEGQLRIEEFGEDYVYPICSPELVNNGTIASPEDLTKCRHISMANETLVTWRSWFDHAGVPYDFDNIKKTEVTSSDMAISAVISGHGVSLAVTAMFMPYIHSGQVVVPFNIRHPIKWKRFLVYSANTAKRARIKVFTEWLQEEMRATTEDSVF